MDSENSEYPAITQFTKSQRRVIGVLLEKAFTTPDSYPLTLKSLTTGSNQKSNRDPVTNYTEDAIQPVLDELRKMGAVAVVHMDSSRSERFRHYMRKRFNFSEKQLAILAELFLRGRQSLGELRARAGRMVPIESLAVLRSELEILKQDNFIQASGSLERRGIEVDHNFYPEKEKVKFLAPAGETETVVSEVQQPITSQSNSQESPSSGYDFQEDISQLQKENSELIIEFQQLKAEFEQIKAELNHLRTELGG